MAGRPTKSLEAHVRDGSFRARRQGNRRLLLGPPLRWPRLAELQAEYARAGSEPERRAAALAFERLISSAHEEARRRSGAPSNLAAEDAAALAAELAALGRPGSAAQLLRFFPAFLSHPKGGR